MRQTFKMHFVAAALHKITAETKMVSDKNSKASNGCEIKLRIERKQRLGWYFKYKLFNKF